MDQQQLCTTGGLNLTFPFVLTARIIWWWNSVELTQKLQFDLALLLLFDGILFVTSFQILLPPHGYMASSPQAPHPYMWGIQVSPIFPRLVDLPLDKFQTALSNILQGTAQSGPALTPAEVLVAIHDINPERDGLVLKKETIKKKLNSSEGVDGIEELVSGGKKSHGPGWLIGRHGSSLIKTSTQAPPQTDL